ncbi:pilus assembly protein [Desulfopila aestuarii]|uniref:Type IV pilus assembly protein PilY1 n=1 Tax=Desulfopila aestuarii DSM 18488 TaxID=1121416 RepID=A0A1M7Y1J9_9BACT|nr:hypothetical protein [Desulfopila aestuarii]SHO45680.1 hypothetical protein SAMN02745220_01175 [Desulfopila aestuarii DSM 18488]
MKSTKSRLKICICGLVLLLLSEASVSRIFAADVCSTGVSEPPFLSFGVKSNLLLVLDNSGSMLDMAYTDPDKTQCFDDSYGVDPTMQYVGNFKPESWYKRVDGIDPWSTGISIATTGKLVSAEGSVYRALNIGTSDGSTIFEDTKVKWEPVLRPAWRNNTQYHAGSFVFDATTSKVFMTISGGTSNGTGPTSDNGVTWTQINTWKNSTAYTVGTYVIWKGSSELYKAQNGGTSNGSSPWDDKEVTWKPMDFHGWQEGRIYYAGNVVTQNSMIFIHKSTVSSHTSSGNDIYEDTFDTNWQRIDEGYFEEVSAATATSFCVNASGSKKYKANDVCITLDPATDVSSGKVSAFAAKGSFLNWAMSSKFDIEKNILTGGKYDTGAGRIVNESRGCAGNRFIKQVLLDQGTALTSDDMYLTMSVRGSGDNDRTDISDDIGRFEIYAVTKDGMDFGACQRAIEAFQAPTGLGPAEDDVADCVGIAKKSSNVEHIIYHKAIQECWFYAKQGRWKGGNDHPFKTCPQYYELGNIPGLINDTDPAYACYGVYDNGYHEDRTGFVGRCWEDAHYISAECTRVCGNIPSSGSYPYVFVSGKEAWECTNKDTEFYCPDYNSGGKKCKVEWVTSYRYSENKSPGCVPGGTDDVYVAAGWSTNLDGDTPEMCVDQAMHDFCLQAEVPEVIDPSDQVTTTDEYWNLPALLVDTGLAGQLGGQPLATFKGTTKYVLPTDQQTDDVHRPNGPRGILYEVASDLRIGAMAFSDNGSLTECDGVNKSDTVIEYCPATNRDGASIIADIDIGYYVDENGTTDNENDDFENWNHYNTLVQAINNVRATSWTPLAEAVFNALGYYTQDSNKRLNPEDFTISAATDPITNWCQENHVLIITEGASTADINQSVIGYIDDIKTQYNFSDGDINKTCTVPDSITGLDVGLQGSTYLDDLTNIGHNLDVNYLFPAGHSTITTTDGDVKNKQNITTHIVSTGIVPTNGTDECSPGVMIKDAATKGGTTLVESENPASLRQKLLETFNELRQRSSSGSAASVISSSRGGEGAIYQAIFWPELKRTHSTIEPDPNDPDCSPDPTNPDCSYLPVQIDKTVEWVGDVHALFINDAGYMFEDTNGDRKLVASEDIDGDGHLDVKEDANGNGLLDPGEDLDGDQKLDIAEDLNGNNVIDGDDMRVIVYYDELLGKSKGCYNTTVLDSAGICTFSKNLEDIKFIWSAANWLNDSALLTSTNRNNYLSSDPRRYIFTWVDLNNNGKVDDDYDGSVDNDDEVRPFEEGLALNSSGTNLTVSGTRLPVYADYGVSSSSELDAIIKWTRGEDSLINEDVNDNNILDSGEDLNNNGRLDGILRSRQIPTVDNGTTLTTWRLGDVIHSTPMTVSEPAEGYHYLYRDRTYADFVAKYKNRRHMVYFGANDGMLHAVNAGFYNGDEKKFCLSGIITNGVCDESAGNFPALGAEMWAYVPANIAPHLSCLTDVACSHKYMVDLRPRIFDVKIFGEEQNCSNVNGILDSGCIHPEGWGTILVGGMRLGGSPVNAYDVSPDTTDSVANDNRRFISSYFILDITNPEAPPVLLGELTQTLDTNGAIQYVDLGYSTSIATMVIMKNPATYSPGTESNEWYLVLGSGPHGSKAMQGVSDQNAKVSILPLSWLGATDVTDSTLKTPLRIPAGQPTSLIPGGTFELSGPLHGFVSDPITVDFDINPSSFDYMSDSVYFGTIDGEFSPKVNGSTEWSGGGKLYRLVTRNMSGGISQYGLGVVQTPTTPDKWELKPMLDLSNENKPISSAPNAGYDGRNFWIYFGTGRFMDAQDKTDDNRQTFFGLKEPMTFDTTTGEPTAFLWGEIEFADNINPTDGNYAKDSNGIILSSKGAGDRGLLRVDDILVTQGTGDLTCRDTSDLVYGAPLAGANAMKCVPKAIRTTTSPEKANFAALEKYIAGTLIGNCSSDKVDCTDGWYKDFWPYGDRQKNLGQGTLLGGLMTFTTYQPFSDTCQAEGEAYLYGVYYKTGTSWYKNVFGDNGVDSYGNVENMLKLGRGLATTPNLHTGEGGEEGVRAFIQTSTGEIKEIQQENLPVPGYKSGRSKWKEYLP